MTAFPRIYYNEIDKHACAWLGENMRRGLIAPGDIDDRSIELVQPGDLAGYVQCHFFAGIGVWSHAARLAGWQDTRPLWTGSCPCQPFSVAGKRGGTADRRHLWPHLFRLIGACGPPVVMGEQVAQAAGWNWFNGVRSDLAGAAYQCRGIGLCSCAVDSPDERERIYWSAVADPMRTGGREVFGSAPCHETAHGRARRIGCEPDRCHEPVGDDEGFGAGSLVNSPRVGWGEGWSPPVFLRRRGAAASADARREMGHGDRQGLSLGSGIAGDAREERPAAGGADDAAEPVADGDDGRDDERQGQVPTADVGTAARRTKFWLGRCDDGERNRSWYADAEWIDCHDGKARRAKPGTSMLVAGSPGRIPLWRGLGGSINAQLAKEVIAAFMDASETSSPE